MVITKRGSFTYNGREAIRGIGSSLKDTQVSGSGNDTLSGSSNNDYLTANGGDDILYGEAGLDSLYGGDHNDSLYGGDDDDLLAGGFGDDTLYGESGTDTLYGGPENDYLDGGDNDDTLLGNSNNDILFGGQGNDYLVGGTLGSESNGGYDIASYSGPYTAYTVSFMNRNGDVQVTGSEGTDRLQDIDQINFADGGVFKIYTGGSGVDDVLTADPNYASLMDGNAGNDTLTGSNGNDTLSGGYSYDNGSDVLIGGGGYDIATYLSSFPTYSAAFTSSGNVQIASNEGTDLLTSIEHITFVDGFYNVYTGDGSNNRLTAASGVWSLLYGGNGNDTLIGGNYNDTLTGGNGNDTILGGSGYDRATYFGSFPTYSATFTSNGNIQVVGSEGTDLLSGIEHIAFADGFYNVYTGTGNNDTLTADPNVWSLLYGGSGSDLMTGGNYNDTIEGGRGTDLLVGGAGSDQFKFGSSSSTSFGNTNVDTITDFIVGTDKIALGRTSFSALQGSTDGSLLSSEFAVITNDSQAGISSAKIVYNSVNGNLFYNSDGATSGLGVGGQFATLTGSPDNLSNLNFVVTSI